MDTPPPLYSNQRATDQEHLNLLSVFHFVNAGLSLMGCAGLFFAFAMVGEALHRIPMKDAAGNPPPPQLIPLLTGMFFFLGIMGLLAGLANLLAGIYLRQRKNRMFTLIVAGFNCLNIPLGTALGIFTFIVLQRDSVLAMYRETQAGA
jgi:hypothetical protein